MGMMDAQLDTVGSVSAGLLAASWSPDGDLVAFVTGPGPRTRSPLACPPVVHPLAWHAGGCTGHGTLLTMTREFVPVNEVPIRVNSLGAGVHRAHPASRRVARAHRGCERNPRSGGCDCSGTGQRRVGAQGNPVSRARWQGGRPVWRCSTSWGRQRRRQPALARRRWLAAALVARRRQPPRLLVRRRGRDACVHSMADLGYVAC